MSLDFQTSGDATAWLDEVLSAFHCQTGTLHRADGEFLDLVVPELQRRGLFRREYEGRTLRENLGLARPKHDACKSTSMGSAHLPVAAAE